MHQSLPAIPIEPSYLALLGDLKVDQFPHLHGSARDHLVGVYAILSGWGNRKEVCLAGLFHNIYGTEVFKPKAVDLSRRAEIRAVLGEEAEQLAFLFCVTRRIGFFDDHANPAAPVLWDEVHKCKVTVTPAQLAALIELEVANGMEQYSPDLGLPAQELDSLLQTASWMAGQARGKLSPAASQALATLIASLRNDRARLTA